MLASEEPQKRWHRFVPEDAPIIARTLVWGERMLKGLVPDGTMDGSLSSGKPPAQQRTELFYCGPKESKLIDRPCGTGRSKINANPALKCWATFIRSLRDNLKLTLMASAWASCATASPLQ
jgi:hypothetical protein